MCDGIVDLGGVLSGVLSPFACLFIIMIHCVPTHIVVILYMLFPLSTINMMSIKERMRIVNTTRMVNTFSIVIPMPSKLHKTHWSNLSKPTSPSQAMLHSISFVAGALRKILVPLCLVKEWGNVQVVEWVRVIDYMMKFEKNHFEGSQDCAVTEESMHKVPSPTQLVSV